MALRVGGDLPAADTAIRAVSPLESVLRAGRIAPPVLRI